VLAAAAAGTRKTLNFSNGKRISIICFYVQRLRVATRKVLLMFPFSYVAVYVAMCVCERWTNNREVEDIHC